jgi:hypothetical protein
MMIPVIIVSVNSASTPEPALDLTVLPTTKDIALVVCTLMKTELVKIAPTGVESITAYKPWIGFTPAKTPAAMASGTLSTPKVNPAIMSDRMVLRLILT